MSDPLRKTKSATSIRTLSTQLRQLGVAHGDLLMVHASLRAVGPTEGRAAGLIQALLDAVGEAGTLMAYVDYEASADLPYFDPVHSPAAVDYGALAEEIRRWPTATRSLNPGASVAAIGAAAAWLCADHPLDYGYGLGSPFAKLVERQGKVVLLGSDFDHVTLLHYAEHIAPLPQKRVVRRDYRMKVGEEIVARSVEEFDTSEPVVDGMPTDYFAQITQAFVDGGRAASGTVGRALAVLLPAAELVQFAVETMGREYGGRV
ncbi:MAG: aminoglycoside 3-N-acetyltransferase [Anaerolineales bacterium]|nr:aminoglycoside 3-N-acetyltransferase [Anaerolineales bacterium]